MPRRLSLNFFGKAFNDMPGALSSSAANLPVLTLQQKDEVYLYELPRVKPWLLDAKVFHLAHLVDTEYHSRKAYEALVNMTLISPEGEVNTSIADKPGFGTEILNRLAIIPQIKIRMIVDFLFWWEEESARLKKLVSEKHNLEASIASGQITAESSADVKAMLHSVETRIATLPSKRDEAVEAGLLYPSPQNDETASLNPPPYST